MADTEVENAIGYVDKRRNNKGQDLGHANGNPVAGGTSDSSNLTTVAGLRARLTAINAAYYTPTMLNRMTKNDMVHAVRQADDAAGIK